MRYVFAAMMLVATPALALGVKPPEMSTPVTLEQSQAQGQAQTAEGGNATSNQSQQQSVGDTTALSIQDQSANNEGVQVQTTYRQVRQAPQDRIFRTTQGGK